MDENVDIEVDFTEIELVEFIAFGSYGDVHWAKWKSAGGEKTIAIKKLRTKDNFSKIERELKNLSRLKHKHIVKFLGMSKDKSEIVHILLEYADCGTLYDLLHEDKNKDKHISYMDKIDLLIQCAEGIEYLHRQNVVHRDLKTTNLLLFDDYRLLKLCDFGTVREIASKMTLETGTVGYMAPEVLDSKNYNVKCDVYSFGIIIWEVMSRKKPFYHLGSVHEYYIQTKVKKGERPSLADVLSENFIDTKPLIERCWDSIPNKRPTMCELINTLKIDKIEKNIDFEEIKLQNCIGNGKFGDVFRTVWKNEQGEKMIAAKQLTICNSKEEIVQHFKKLLVPSHENIVTFYGISEDKENRLYILSEYAECGSLYDFLYALEQEKVLVSIKEKLKWMQQCAKGMAFLHDHNILHRSLKPKNLMLFNNYGILKICDFGIVGEISSSVTNETFTAPYLAPEAAEKGSYDTKSDVFSYGIVFWEVIVEKKPFDDLKSDGPICLAIIKGQRPPLDDINDYDNFDHIKLLIEMCWHKNPIKRPTMKELVHTLSKGRPLPETSDQDLKDELPIIFK